jgi:hypothetical protein
MVVGPAPPVLSGEPLVRNVRKVLAENLKERYRIEDLEIQRTITLKWNLQKSGVDWIHFAQDRGLRRVSVNAIMNICVTKEKAWNFSTCCDSQGR